MSGKMRVFGNKVCSAKCRSARCRSARCRSASSQRRSDIGIRMSEKLPLRLTLKMGWLRLRKKNHAIDSSMNFASKDTPTQILRTTSLGWAEITAFMS